MCENTVTYVIPKGYDYKEVFGTCGQTGYDGGVLICQGCADDPRKLAEIERHEANIAHDNAWARSAGWGEF
jgi:hypothetical protein|tara:strand:+ start:734 stop:946 length:213 start_codon:yes stop_codon:yes gene_type:complete